MLIKRVLWVRTLGMHHHEVKNLLVVVLFDVDWVCIRSYHYLNFSFNPAFGDEVDTCVPEFGCMGTPSCWLVLIPAVSLVSAVPLFCLNFLNPAGM